MAAPSHHSRGLYLVATLKLAEAVGLVLLALGAFHLLHRDVDETLEHWIRMAHIDPGNRRIGMLLAKAGVINDHLLKQIGGLTLAYAALFFVESAGLFCRQRWAEYLTVIATASLIPFEFHELVKHASALKLAVLLGNVAIVIYLIVVLRRNGKHGASAARS